MTVLMNKIKLIGGPSNGESYNVNVNHIGYPTQRFIQVMQKCEYKVENPNGDTQVCMDKSHIKLNVYERMELACEDEKFFIYRYENTTPKDALRILTTGGMI